MYKANLLFVNGKMIEADWERVCPEETGETCAPLLTVSFDISHERLVYFATDVFTVCILMMRGSLPLQVRRFDLSTI
ncbi:MAG TPA: hypothetical protein VD966_09745, partial [Pyrinomonadaceae bacterium]|nr:hypothetical protein [Pyrinomonadaceae bacterium]